MYLKRVNTMKLKLNKKFGIGTFFTPLKWAKWLLTEFNIFEAWLKGATICDPTAGSGIFLEAFIILAREKNIEITNEMINRLYGIEKEEIFVRHFKYRIKRLYKFSFPEKNYINADIILSNPKIKADILVGNPPWLNFADLPEDYKLKIKPYFHIYNLVENPQKLLLGSSRIDIAALILAIVINDNLNKYGDAYFFVPLSLFLNGGAHGNFRQGITKDVKFGLKEIYDFNGFNVFTEVSTRYGVAHFKRNVENLFPIKYRLKIGNNWITNFAMPIHSSSAALSIFKNKKQLIELNNSFDIEVDTISRPRQGVNTCGANNVFIFENSSQYNDRLLSVVTKDGQKTLLPRQFVYPLVSKSNFREKNPIPHKFILLPYEPSTGKPLLESELKKYPELWRYLLKNKKILINRRGTLINTWIKKGIWWALLGVGKYSFFPYKIIWEAYGQKTFHPKLFSSFKSQPWQGNQALHAYIPLLSKNKAEDVIIKLSNPAVEKYLHSFRMEGTCNWAQPGRISKIIKYTSP